MKGDKPRTAWLAAALVVAAALSVASSAGAEVEVSIRYDTEDRVELAERLRSELESEGYDVAVAAGAELTPCDAGGSPLVTSQRTTKAWIRLSEDAHGGETLVASICFLGALPFVQQASSSAPSSDPHALAVATAEALNGLRAKLPPLVAEPGRPERRERPAPRAPSRRPPPRELVNGVAIGPALFVGLPEHPPALAVTSRTVVGIGPHAALTLDALVPTTGAELRGAGVTATVRTAWLRIGPRFHGELGDFLVASAALGGPAVTWATAVARAPRVGTTDVSTGAVLSLATSVEFPRDTAVYASAAASMSVLLPGVRVKLGDDPAPPRGFFPLEASIGLGLRWGSVR